MKFCASINLLFSELPALDRPAAAAKAGFQGIEIQNFAIEDPHRFAEAADAANMPVILLNVPLGDLLQGGAGLSGDPQRKKLFLEALSATRDAAKLLNPHFINVGAFRADDPDPASWLATYTENIAHAVRLFEDLPATPLIEPMNETDIPGVRPHNLDFASALLREKFPTAAALQFDTYHAAQRGEPIADAFATCADLVRHVQISDWPGRHEPGAGELDFPGFFSMLETRGYDGFVGAEYAPATTTADSLGWLKTTPWPDNGPAANRIGMGKK